MATLRPLDRCTAEETIPYAPSPMTAETLYLVPVGAMSEKLQCSGNIITPTDVEPNFTRLGSGGSVAMAFAWLPLLLLVVRLSYGNGWFRHCRRQWWWWKLKGGWREK